MVSENFTLKIRRAGRQQYFRCFLAILFSLSWLQNSYADNVLREELELSLSSEAEITITKFGDGGSRVLWIPSEYGFNENKHYALAEALSKQQHEVWLTRLHESYFIPPGRSSYTKIPVGDVAELIQKILIKDDRKLFVLATGRGAALLLLALDQWRNETGGSERLAGLVLIQPNLQAKTPTPGEAMDYLSVVDNSQYPVYILQPKKSNKVYYLQDLVSRLSSGGSKVYMQIIDGAGDGYHVRSNASDAEVKLSMELPLKISKAINRLGKTRVSVDSERKRFSDSWEITPVPESIVPYPTNALAPVLELSDTEGNEHKLDDYRGKVVVLNFWASWCPPCIDEIPSLERLQNAFSKNKLLVLTLNIGEEKNEIETFMKKLSTKLPVLLNLDGSTVKRWKVIAFPTTFIIDREGRIAYAYFGGLEWDAPDVVKQLQKLTQ